MSQLLHVIGATSQTFDIYARSGKSVTTYKVTNRNATGSQWTIYRMREEKATPLVNLSVNPRKGIAIATHEDAPTSGKTIVDPEVLLTEFYPESCDCLPSESNPDRGGSILLAVCLRVATMIKTEDQGIRINAASAKQNASVDLWVEAYTAIEARYKLPSYLRAEFISVMASHKLEITFPESQKEEQKEEQPATPQTIIEVKANQNGKAKNPQPVGTTA